MRAVDGCSRALGIAAAGLLVAAMLVVCQLIFLRYVFRAPTVWQTDFVVYAATAAIFLGAPYVLLTKGHVGVDVVETMVGPRARRGMRAAGGALGFAFCAAMAVASFAFMVEAAEMGWETPGIWKIPQWIPILPIPLGFALLCLQYVAEALKALGARPR